MSAAWTENPLHETSRQQRGMMLRWLKFNLVGALGIAVQLAVLLALRSTFHLGYLPSTALAVESAVIHNFLWHERYTWADRLQPSWEKSLPRLLRFNGTIGAVSILGNLAFAIAFCSLLNFLVSERWVFRTR
jgi:putative flippase GtrA